MICCDVSPSPELILFNGKVITCTDNESSEITAVASTKGHISAIGKDSDILALAKEGYTRAINLKGNCLMPGFIDAHSHLASAVLLKNLVDCSAAKDLVALGKILKEQYNKQQPDAAQLFCGKGYDSATFHHKEGQDYITKNDLDEIFPEVPVGIFHNSMHGVILNSKGLQMFNIDETTDVPTGGYVTRDDDGRLTGGIWEAALMKIIPQFRKSLHPNMTHEKHCELLHDTQILYASQGYTTISEGNTDGNTCHFLLEAAKEKRIFLDVISIPTSKEMDSLLIDLKYNVYFNKLKFGGIKFILDGTLQNKTGHLSTQYSTGGNGLLLMKPEDLNAQVKKVVETGIQAYAHCMGDGAIDSYLNALELAGINNGDVKRHVVIHSQYTRTDQLDVYKKYNMVPSFFTNQVYYDGDTLMKVMEERAHHISPLKTAIDLGIQCTNHSDYVQSPLSPLTQMTTAVTRTTKKGAVLGSDECVDIMTAIKTLTINSARQYHEETLKGSLEVGKLADFVVLSKSPLEVAPTKLKDLKIQMTFKDGVEVYNRKKVTVK